MRSAARLAPLILGGLTIFYRLLVRGALTLDLGIGRRTRALGPISMHIAAPREVVFDVIARPYLGKVPRAMAGKLQILERGSDLVLAAHFTPLGSDGVATTIETVRFQRPERIEFRLVRGPVPHVIETFELRIDDRGTRFDYRGELGTDLWMLGQWWGERVGRTWEQTVRRSLEDIRAEAERSARTAIKRS